MKTVEARKIIDALLLESLAEWERRFCNTIYLSRYPNVSVRNENVLKRIKDRYVES